MSYLQRRVQGACLLITRKQHCLQISLASGYVFKKPTQNPQTKCAVAALMFRELHSFVVVLFLLVVFLTECEVCFLCGICCVNALKIVHQTQTWTTAFAALFRVSPIDPQRNRAELPLMESELRAKSIPTTYGSGTSFVSQVYKR